MRRLAAERVRDATVVRRDVEQAIVAGRAKLAERLPVAIEPHERRLPSGLSGLIEQRSVVRDAHHPSGEETVICDVRLFERHRLAHHASAADVERLRVEDLVAEEKQTAVEEEGLRAR